MQPSRSVVWMNGWGWIEGGEFWKDERHKGVAVFQVEEYVIILVLYAKSFGGIIC